MKTRIRVDELKPDDRLVSLNVVVARVYPSKTIKGRTIVIRKGTAMGNVWLNESMIDVERE